MTEPYPEYMMESVRKVEATREERKDKEFDRVSDDEAMEILKEWHPDYRKSDPEFFREIAVGPSKGKTVPTEVANVLEAYPWVDPKSVDLSVIEHDAEVFVIGTGGAGLAAILWANNEGVKMEDIVVSTKLRLGDSNSKMSQGGIQACDGEDDSPLIHWLDVMSGGHWTNDRTLARQLVMNGPSMIKWMELLGAEFDKHDDGGMQELMAGGASRKRIHSCKDYTGLELERVLMDEALSRGMRVLEFCPTVSLLTDDSSNVTGGLVWNLETEEYHVVRAKTTVIATGGFGRLHVAGFPTTNHYGATCDGVVMAYRAGADIVHMQSTQYHPTGAAYPEQIVGLLITEKCRSMGAQLVDAEGEAFIYPLETRDVESAAELRQIREGKGVKTSTGQMGVWLDTPLIDEIRGEGAFEEGLAAIHRLYARFDIDASKYPVLVHPTLHYQNGGIAINADAQAIQPNGEPIGRLFTAGETTGGVHGDNRLMGNSWLELLVYGRRAGISAARLASKTKMPRKSDLKLTHLTRYSEELQKSGVKTERCSPIILPNYLGENTMAPVGYGKETPFDRRLDLFT
ncbi:FAD-binding protein [Candidatus Thorarchaeota archaeon]|nr:MAG: FAD-binding protein [Candidatus Thorarchaeota archaeon]